MSAAPSTSAPSTALSIRGRTALAAVAPLGPLAMVGWAMSTPYSPGADVPASAAAIQADPLGAQVGLLCLILAGIFGAAGSLVVGSAIRPGAPRLAAAATCIAFVGFCVAAYPGPVATVAAAPAAGIGAEQALSLVAVIDAQVQGAAVSMLFATLPAGVLLLGIAALVAARRGRYAWNGAILLAVAMPLVMLGGFVASWALACGWIVVTIAFAHAGLTFAHPFTRVTTSGA